MVNSIQSGGVAYTRLRPLLAPALGVQGEPKYASFRPGLVTGLHLPVVYPASAERGPSAVSLRHLTSRYPGAAEPALRDVSLDLLPRDAGRRHRPGGLRQERVGARHRGPVSAGGGPDHA